MNAKCPECGYCFSAKAHVYKDPENLSDLERNITVIIAKHQDKKGEGLVQKDVEYFIEREYMMNNKAKPDPSSISRALAELRSAGILKFADTPKELPKYHARKKQKAGVNVIA